METNYTLHTLKVLTAGVFAWGLFHSAQAQTKPQSEADFYELRTLAIPEDIKLEVGGLAVLPDGRLGVSTRRGEIWVIENPYMTNGTMPYYTRFASGMHEVLGLAYKDGSFYCTQRGELTKLTDTDNDGQADKYEPVYKFDLSGNYHEYAYGPIFDSNGDMLVTLNVAWIGYGESLSKWHGWLLKIHKDGSLEPIAAGLRSPAGFTLTTKGDIFYAENQGDWVGSGRVTQLEKGDFAGNAGSLNWTKEPESPIKLTKAQLKAVDNGQPMHEAAKTIKELKLPAVWFPHTLMGISTSDILEDTTAGSFGPFAGQYFVADQGHSKVMRMTLEKVNGKYQGACFPFREGFASGLLRLRWGLDGSMFGGMTSRGWASTGPKNYAVQRLVWTGKTPFEMKDIQARPDGLEIEFTRPVDKKTAQDAKNYDLNSFTYKYHHLYGSPVMNSQACALKGIIVSEDGKKVRLVMDGLRQGYIHEVRLADIKAADGTPLLHNFGFYTLNSIPEGAKTQLTQAQTVSMHNHAAMVTPAKGTTGAKAAPATTTAAPKATVQAKRLTKMPADWGQPDHVITIGTKPGLKFSIDEIRVKAGSKVKLVFNNNDDMTHNCVIVKPGTVNEVGTMALNLGLKGSEMDYVPNTPKVLFHTQLLEPNKTEAIYFIAPAAPANYTFVCTYPGHFTVMQGKFIVTN
jgi:azurin